MSSDSVDRPAASRPEPLPLEEAQEPCPNCGTPLAGPGATVCLHCGYDLEAVRQRPTVVGRPVEVPPEEAERSSRASAAEHDAEESGHGRAKGAPLAPPRATRIPLIVAGVAILILVVGYLAGAGGLFPREAGLYRDAAGNFTSPTVRWPERLLELLQFVIRVAVLSAATGAAAALTARIKRVPLGDLATLGARVLAIAAASNVALLLKLESQPVEALAQLAIGAAIFVGLVILWFKLPALEALQTLAMTVVAAVAVHGIAWLVVWATF